MKILVTGSKGFIGKNLISELKNQGYSEIFEYDRGMGKTDLEKYAGDCEFVFHLAGVNRTSDETEFMKGNYDLSAELLELLKKHNNKASILITSSVQALANHAYGKSKIAAEMLMPEYAAETGSKVYIYRLTNLFGKWSRPNYNMVAATYCHNIARGLDIQINNPETLLRLCYIDDVVAEFIRAMKDEPTKDDSLDDGYYAVPESYCIRLGDLAKMIQGFKESRENLQIPNMNDELTKKMYSTYLSFLPKDGFAYDLKMNIDNRGSFTEFLKTVGYGQVSVNISKPGITKGNHWHHTKNEKFLVVSGEGLIRFRRVDAEEIIEYKVNGDKLRVLDIPVGYTHSIVNTGLTEMVTVMWANEPFDPDNLDTYRENV